MKKMIKNDEKWQKNKFKFRLTINNLKKLKAVKIFRLLKIY